MSPKSKRKARGSVKAKAKATSERESRKTTRTGLRRAAVKEINRLLKDLSLDELLLTPKSVEVNALGRALRVLEKRCVDRAGLRAAVEKWCSNGGKLPGGITLAEDAVEAMSDDEENNPLVPGHRVLKATYELKSKAFMLTYNSRAFTPETWSNFRSFIEALHAKLGSRAYAACMEESLHQALGAGNSAQKRYHAHAYFLWTDGVGYRSGDLDEFVFEGVRPRVDKCMAGANARSPRRAALHGLWYVCISKAGTLAKATSSNWTPWVEYVPSGAWLVRLWENHKLDNEQFLEYSVMFRSGHGTRRKEVLQVMADMNASAVRKHVASEQAELAEKRPKKPFKEFVVVDRYVDLFTRCEERRPILVIVGGTNTGKSLLAREVLRRVGLKLGLSSFVEVTVEADDHLDFSKLVVSRDAGALLDGVGDVTLLQKNREVLQGRPKECAGGKSSTMIYSYVYTLSRRAVVVTMDLSCKKLHLLRTDHWLASEKNVVQLWLEAPSWECAAEAPAALALSPREKMENWNVGALAAYLEEEDAEGLAALVRRNSVNGADLLTFSAVTCVEDLCCTPFASRKLLALRDKYLAG